MSMFIPFMFYLALGDSFASFTPTYGFYIDLLMELHEQNPNQGYDAKALHASALLIIEGLAVISPQVHECFYQEGLELAEDLAALP